MDLVVISSSMSFPLSRESILDEARMTNNLSSRWLPGFTHCHAVSRVLGLKYLTPCHPELVSGSISAVMRDAESPQHDKPRHSRFECLISRIDSGRSQNDVRLVNLRFTCPAVALYTLSSWTCFRIYAIANNRCWESSAWQNASFSIACTEKSRRVGNPSYDFWLKIKTLFWYNNLSKSEKLKLHKNKWISKSQTSVFKMLANKRYLMHY